MKVALLADQYFNPSGVGVYTRELLRHLPEVSASIEFVVLHPATDATKERALARCGLEVRRLPDRRFLYPAWHWGVGPSIERWAGEVDLVHFVSASVRVRSRAPLLAGITDIASELEPESYPWRRRQFKRALLRTVGAGGGQILTISQTVSDDLVAMQFVPPERVSYTYLGVDHSIYRPQDPADTEAYRKTRGLPPTFFLFVGAVSPRKNVELLIKAYAQYVNDGGTASLVLAGPDVGWKNSDTYRMLEELVSAGRAHLVGFVPDEEMALLYASAVALVLPSRREGFGMPVTECMACGTPVLCSRGGSLPEIAGDAARYFDPESVDELRLGLVELSGSPEVAHDAGAAGLHQAARYRWEETARKTVEVYERLL